MNVSDKSLLGATVSLIGFDKDGRITALRVITLQQVEYEIFPVQGGPMDIS